MKACAGYNNYLMKWHSGDPEFYHIHRSTYKLLQLLAKLGVEAELQRSEANAWQPSHRFIYD